MKEFTKLLPHSTRCNITSKNKISKSVFNELQSISMTLRSLTFIGHPECLELNFKPISFDVFLVQILASCKRGTEHIRVFRAQN